MPFEDRVKYMEQGTGQVFYLWQDEDENDWALGCSTGRKVELRSSADSTPSPTPRSSSPNCDAGPSEPLANNRHI
jgi:hypothetical protein